LEKNIRSDNGVSSRRRSMIEGIIQQAPIVGSAFGLVKTSAELKALKKSQRIEAANRLTQSYRLEWKKGAPTPRRVEYDGLTSRRINGLS